MPPDALCVDSSGAERRAVEHASVRDGWKPSPTCAAEVCGPVCPYGRVGARKLPRPVGGAAVGVHIT